MEKLEARYSDTDRDYLLSLPEKDQMIQATQIRVTRAESKINEIIDHLNGKEEQGEKLSDDEIDAIRHLINSSTSRHDQYEGSNGTMISYLNLDNKLTRMKGKA